MLLHFSSRLINVTQIFTAPDALTTGLHFDSQKKRCLPGMVHVLGRPPVAINVCVAFNFSPFTSTQPSSVNLAWPINF